jgi:septal ring factor EnvC (AmiA/AmiB activator)
MAVMRAAACVAFAAALVAGAGAAQAPDGSGQAGGAEAASRRAAERIKALQKESDALVTQERSLLAELRKLEIDRELRVEELNEVQREAARTAKALADTRTRADSLKAAAEAERPDVEARLVQLYKLGRAGYWRLLLDAEDVRAIGRAYRTAATMTHVNRERLQAHARTLEALTHERQTLENRARALATLRQRAVAAREAADRAVAARSALVASIDERRDLNAQLTGELEAAQLKLQQSIAQLGSERAPAALPLRPFRGALPWPADGIVTQRFGRMRPGRTVTESGIEMSLAEGQTVRSVHDGTVAFAGPFTGYGNLVIVEHGDGAYSLYGHLRSLGVERGAHVDAQAPVGESGRNPSGNPALYFELRVDGKPVDPLQWLRKSL